MNKSDLLSNPLLDEPTITPKETEGSDQFLDAMFKEMFKDATAKVSEQVDKVNSAAGKSFNEVIKKTQGQSITGSIGTRANFQQPDLLEGFRDSWLEKLDEPWKKSVLRNYCNNNAMI